MATTAAPTFFPPYKINNVSYLDGGVHLNNPSQAAYCEALRHFERQKRNVERENMFVLSLGTGSYMPDPFNPELCEGQLFWARNFHTVALAAQESNIDAAMYLNLRENYTRWQTCLDGPIFLDDATCMEHLLELGYQYIEELYESDDNEMNKLIERLLKDHTFIF